MNQMCPLTTESNLSDREAHLIERARKELFVNRLYLVREEQSGAVRWFVANGAAANSQEPHCRFFELPITDVEPIR